MCVSTVSIEIFHSTVFSVRWASGNIQSWVCPLALLCRSSLLSEIFIEREGRRLRDDWTKQTKTTNHNERERDGSRSKTIFFTHPEQVKRQFISNDTQWQEMIQSTPRPTIELLSTNDCLTFHIRVTSVVDKQSIVSIVSEWVGDRVSNCLGCLLFVSMFWRSNARSL